MSGVTLDKRTIPSNKVQHIEGQTKSMEYRRGKNRGRLEIMYSILDSALSDVGKTRVMYKANLSYEQLTYYLSDLIRIGLIQAIEGDGRGMRYRTTEKGRDFLLQYDNIAEILIAGSKNEVYHYYDNVRKPMAGPDEI